MDIHCKHCGEPFDADSLHDMYNANGKKFPYAVAAKLFAKNGCGALSGFADMKCTNSVYDENAAMHASVLQDLSDSPDDWGDF